MRTHATGSYLPLPAFLLSKRHGTLVSVRSVCDMDRRCFGYAVHASIKNVDITERPEHTKDYDERDLRAHGLHGLEHPMRMDGLDRMECLRDIPISMLTFFDKSKARKPVNTSKFEIHKGRHILSFGRIMWSVTSHEIGTSVRSYTIQMEQH
jgi:hypothetical protein